MKKLLISIIKIPIFVLRSINAALMRLPISFIISVIAYAAIFLTDIFDVKWIGVDAIILHIAVAVLISLVWGIVYTLSKPPLIKRIYNSEASKTRAELSRLVVGFLIAAYAYLSKNLPTLPRYYLLFFGGELVLNALLILIKARTKPQLAKAMGAYQGNASSVPASKEAKPDDAKQSLIDDFKNNTAPSVQKIKASSIQTDKNANILVTIPRSFVPAIQEINPDVLLSKERVSEIKNILNSAKLTHQQKKELKKYEEN